jgi:tRNA pseudouridine55 synthase
VVMKPAGITSTQVVGKIRWAFDAQKAGHAGTLDPAATGILAVALGEATKTVAHVTDSLKSYRFRVRFGAETTTDDAEGTVTATSDTRPDDAAIADALGAFRGAIRQVPPQFSAVKLDGERAYDLARAGEVLDLAARDLWVERLEILGRPDADHVDLAMICGKGGYVRSVARDLGRALGCLGHVAWLHREWSGGFHEDQSVTLEMVEALARTPALMAHLLPVEAGLTDMPVVEASDAGAQRLAHGNPGQVLTGGPADGGLVWARHQGRILAIGHVLNGMLHPDRVLNLREEVAP